MTSTARIRNFFAAVALLIHPCSGIVNPNKNELSNTWRNTHCKHANSPRVNWNVVRETFATVPFPDNAEFAGNVASKLRGTADIDDEAQICVLGIVSVFFVMAKFAFFHLGDRHIALQYYSLFENYVSVMHHGLIEESGWPLTDVEMVEMRAYVNIVQRDIFLEQNPDWQPDANFRIYVYTPDDVPELAALTKGPS